MLGAMKLTQRMVVETTLLIPDNVLEDNSNSTPQTTMQQTTMTVKRVWQQSCCNAAPPLPALIANR